MVQKLTTAKQRGNEAHGGPSPIINGGEGAPGTPFQEGVGRTRKVNTAAGVAGASASSTPDRPAAAVHPVNFLPLTPGSGADEAAQGIDLLLDVQLHVSVELGRTQMSIRDILALRSGSVIELDRLAGEPVDVLVNGTLVARGEVVIVDEKFGVRITEVATKAKRLASLA